MEPPGCDARRPGQHFDGLRICAAAGRQLADHVHCDLRRRSAWSLLGYLSRRICNAACTFDRKADPRNSGWYPDYQMRLYRKDKSFWDGVAPHETARVKGKIETLRGEFLHYTKRNLSEHHRVLDSYTTLAADYHFKSGKTVGAFGIFFFPVASFFRAFILKKGFLDGVPGLIIAMFAAYAVFLRYAKIWEHNNIKK